MTSLLQTLLRHESGGRNIPNVHQGTSSGQAQGYFQITTGTWNEFGGRKYAPTPLKATYEQQAEIASRIPLKRWDESTIRKMRATGKRLDLNRTLGENLAMHGEGGSADTEIVSADSDYYGGASALSQKSPSSKIRIGKYSVDADKASDAFAGGYQALAQNSGRVFEPLQPLTSGGYQAPTSRPTIPVEAPGVMAAPPSPTIHPAVQKALEPTQGFPEIVPAGPGGIANVTNPPYASPAQIQEATPSWIEKFKPGPNQPLIMDPFTADASWLVQGIPGYYGGLVRNRIGEMFTPRDELPSVVRMHRGEEQTKWDQIWNNPTEPDPTQQPGQIVNPDEVLTGPIGSGGGSLGGGGVATAGGADRVTTIPAGKVYIPNPPPMDKEITYPNPPDYVDPPDRPMIQPMDWEPYLKQMGQYAPQDIDRGQYMRERFLGNLSRALAAGAGGSGWSGAGGAIARMGGGFGEGTANTMDRYLEEQGGADEAQRQYGLDMLNLKMRMAQANQQVAGQNANIDYENRTDEYRAQVLHSNQMYEHDVKQLEQTIAVGNSNAARLYDYETKYGALTAPTLEGHDKDSVILRKVDPQTGNITFEVHRYSDPISPMNEDTLKLLNAAKTFYGENSPQVLAAQYAPLFALGPAGKFRIQQMMALEAIQNKTIEVLVPDIGEIQETVQDEMLKGGYKLGESGWNEEFASRVATLAATKMNLGDVGMLTRAAQMGNVGALMMLSKVQAMPQPQEAPGSSFGGPR